MPLRITPKYLFSLMEELQHQLPDWQMILGYIGDNTVYKYRFWVKGEQVVVDLMDTHKPETMCAILQFLKHLVREKLVKV